MANLPPVPPAGRAPQGGKPSPKDARAGATRNTATKQGGVSKATQSSRGKGDR